jgi:hypothetical protein
MTTSAWNKFLLLSWKNWLIQLRHPIQTVVEILIPIFVCSFLLLIRALVEVQVVENEIRFSRIPVTTHVSPGILANTGIRALFYSPKNAVLDKIVKEVAYKFILPTVEGFLNAKDLEGQAISRIPFASIEFDQSLADINSASDLPDHVHYALRFPAELRRNDTLPNQAAGNLK